MPVWATSPSSPGSANSGCRETSLGIPPAQIAPFVTERVGLTQARRLMLTGARFKGEEAVQYGIGHILAEDAADMEAKCAEVLEQIALCAPGANAVTKSIVFESHPPPASRGTGFRLPGFRCLHAQRRRPRRRGRLCRKAQTQVGH